jgi:RNA polymerase sigma-70 factor (ECF subfamily)
MNDKKTQSPLAGFLQSEYRKLVNYVKLRFRDTAQMDSEDIVQEVLLKLVDKPDFTIPLDQLAAYVYRSLHNRIIDRFRKKKQEVSLDEELTSDDDFCLARVLYDSNSDPEKQVHREELYAQLHAALDQLPKQQQAIVIATEFEQRSFKELAWEWKKPIGTLLAQKSRALKKVKQLLAAKAISVFF